MYFYTKSLPAPVLTVKNKIMQHFSPLEKKSCEKAELKSTFHSPLDILTAFA